VSVHHHIYTVDNKGPAVHASDDTMQAGATATRSEQPMSSVVAKLHKLVASLRGHFRILGDSPFRDRMSATYPKIQLVVSRVLQAAFSIFMLVMFVHLCMKVIAKEPSVSREKLVWYGHSELPQIAVKISPEEVPGSPSPYSVRARYVRHSGVGINKKATKTDIDLSRRDLDFVGEYYPSNSTEKNVYWFPSGDEMRVGQTWGTVDFWYIDVRIFADKQNLTDGDATIYVKNYLEPKKWIWDSHYYNMNSGYYSTTVEMYFRKVVAKNLFEDSWGFKSYGGVEDLTEDDDTFLQTDYSYSRTSPYNASLVDDDAFILRYRLRSSLAEVNEKYTSYNVASLLEDIGGLSTSALGIVGFVYLVLLSFVDWTGPLISKRPSDLVARHADERSKF